MYLYMPYILIESTYIPVLANASSADALVASNEVQEYEFDSACFFVGLLLILNDFNSLETYTYIFEIGLSHIRF